MEFSWFCGVYNISRKMDNDFLGGFVQITKFVYIY